jgi:hypothetical protein
MSRKITHCAALGILGLSFASVALAEPVEIANPGFEEPFLEAGEFYALSDWSPYNPAAKPIENGSHFGSWNVPTAAYPQGAPVGRNVGWVYNDVEAVIGIQQTVPATVAAHTRYTLTVMVGDPLPYDIFTEFAGFPGYRIELVAAAGPTETILAADHNTLSIPEGTFAQSVVTYTSPAAGPVLGQSLTIRLIAFPGTGTEVDFDDVRLDATPVEPPGSFRISGIQRHPSGEITLTWDSRSGATYSIHASDSFQDFAPIVTGVGAAGVSTTATFQDPASSGGEAPVARFYKVEEESAAGGAGVMLTR